jgi:hypothetical protein
MLSVRNMRSVLSRRSVRRSRRCKPGACLLLRASRAPPLLARLLSPFRQKVYARIPPARADDPCAVRCPWSSCYSPIFSYYSESMACSIGHPSDDSRKRPWALNDWMAFLSVSDMSRRAMLLYARLLVSASARAGRFNCARAESRASASVWQLPHDGTAASSSAKQTRRALLDTLDSADVDT